MRLLILVAEAVVCRVVRNDAAAALDAVLELLAHIVGGGLGEGAAAAEDRGRNRAKDGDNFHRGSIVETTDMAMLIPVETLLLAYRTGIFPMAMGPGDIRWYAPDPRGILPLDGFRVPHGARKTLRDPAWEVRIDTEFEGVMRACGERDETWIDDVIVGSYGRLFEIGHAHSVEVWRDGELAGGLYGVSLGGVFFGESMFSRFGGASKVALASLMRILTAGGFQLLDIQWTTPHLVGFGAVEIPRAEYERRLAVGVELKGDFRWPLA